MLDEAYQLSRSFSEEEQANTLLDIAKAATLCSRERANRWSMELFESAGKMPLGQFRAAMQKNALRTLAINEPDVALRLYRHQDLPSRWLKRGEMLEDVRSFGLGTIFQPIWQNQGQPYLSKLESLADYLGSTGQYPYKALSDIAADLARKKNLAEARKIIAHAASAFMQDSGFQTTNAEFVKFITATHHSATARQLKRELHEATHAIEEPEQSFANAKYLFSVTTPAGTVLFHSRREYLLFRLMPLLRSSLPTEGQAIEERYTGIAAAPKLDPDAPVEMAGAVSILGGASPSSPETKKALDENLLFKVQQAAPDRLDDALRLADQIEDSGLRTVAKVNMAGDAMKSHPIEAAGWLLAGEKLFSTTLDQELKLKLAAALATAYLRQDHIPSADVPSVQDVFRIGVPLFKASMQAKPDQYSYLATGFDELTGVATLAGQFDNNALLVVAAVREVNEPHLRAALLTAAATGLAKRGEVTIAVQH